MHSTSLAVTSPAVTGPVIAVACDGCGAVAGEPCAPLCIGQAAHQDDLERAQTDRAQTGRAQLDRVRHDQPAVTHYRVDAAEMLFDHPEPCPAHPGLTWDGVAAAAPAAAGADRADGGKGVVEHHLIVTIDGPKGPARAYLGPDAETISRRGLILIAALRSHPNAPDLVDQVGILTWLADAWISFHDELADTIAAANASNANRSAGDGAVGVGQREVRSA